jgi:hypothetical protein
VKKLAIIGVLSIVLVLAVALPVNAAVTENDKTPYTMTVSVPCANDGAGETVELTGELHILTTFTEDGGGGIHMKMHYQPQAVHGVGLTTGDKYNAVGVTQETHNIAFDGFPYEDTYVNNFRIIGQGKGNNYLVHETWHVTINANGEVTAEVDNYSVECK